MPQTRWLKQHLVLTGLEARKLKIKALADLGYDEGTYWFLVDCLPVVSSHGMGERELGKERKREGKLPCVFFFFFNKDSNPIMNVPLLWPNYLPKAFPSNTIILELGFDICIWK